MALVRKVIPKIARDIIKNLSQNEIIELEENRANEAELDLAAVMVAHVDAQEEVIREASETLSRLGMSKDRFAQLKQRFADKKGIKFGEEGLEKLLSQMLEALFASKNIEEIYGSDEEIRKVMKESFDKFIKVSDEVEKEARSRLKNLREGTPEWEIEFPRMVAQIKRQKGL